MFYGKLRTIPFMKVDTEGHEFNVLKGSYNLLQDKVIKNMVVEIRSHQGNMLRYLIDRGYKCIMIQEDTPFYFKSCAEMENVAPDKLQRNVENLGCKIVNKVCRKRNRKVFSDIFCCSL